MKHASWISIADRLPDHSMYCCVCKDNDPATWLPAFFVMGDFKVLLPGEQPLFPLTLVEDIHAAQYVTHWLDPGESRIPHVTESLQTILRDECDRRDAELGTHAEDGL